MAEVPLPLLDGYDIRAVIGTGATGTVFLACQLSTGRDVAIKSLATPLLSNPEFRQRFRAEAHLMTRFDSENLVNIYDYLEQDGGASYLVMQHVPGVSLRELIRSSGRLGPEQALEVLAGALSGLAAAHRLGVVHGDLKPENVIVTAEGTSKLIDFGQASPSGSRPSGGSPAYASPEAVRDEAVDARSDIYCAGLILYELLAGTPPFSGSAAEVLAAHQAETPTRLRDVPEGVANLVARSLSKRPEDRPATAEDFLAELEAAATASYGPHWRARASVGALAGGLLGSAAATATGAHGVVSAHATTTQSGISGGVHGAPSGAHALRLSGGRSVFRWVRSARSVAAHHPIVSSVAAAAVIAGAVVAATGATAPLASSWHLASASLAPGAVSCADATHCVALDGQNVIVIGADSKVQIAGLPAASGAVAGISCPSELRCWAVGSTTAGSGTILASSDGGLEWALEPVPSGVGALTAVGCAPHTTDCSALAGTTIIATADGGRWHLSPAPSNVGNYSHISCATTPDCVAAAGGSLVTTSDAGRTWLVVKQSWPELFGVSSLDCVSASVCWLTGNYQSSLMSVAGLVAVSADGGAVWETRALPAKPQLYGVDAISCVSAARCLAVGTVNEGGLEGSSGAPVFAETSDGGAMWRVHPAPSSVVFVPGLQCLRATLCWLSGRNGIGTTSDSGRTWAPLLVPPTVTPGGLWCSSDTSCVLAGAAPFASHYRTGIGGDNPNGPFVVTTTTSGAILVATTDGGQAWDFTLEQRHLTGLGAMACWARGACEVAATIASTTTTTTGIFELTGTRLVQQPAPAGLTAVEGLSCPRRDACWLSGIADGNPVVARAARSKRWALATLPPATSAVGAISCPTSATCLLAAVVASKPVLLVLSGRSRWTALPAPSAVSSFGALDCATSTTCWVAASETESAAGHTSAAGQAAVESVVLRTTSLGSHEIKWATERLPSGLAAATALSCPSQSACLAIAPVVAGGYAVVGAGEFSATVRGSLAGPPRAGG